MIPARFPPGDAAIFSGRPYEESLLAEVDGLLRQGACSHGTLEVETEESRLTCLIHRGVPHLAGLQEDGGFFWVSLHDFPVRARQLRGAYCSLVRSDPARVLLCAVHFRNRPFLQASLELVDLEHVLDVLQAEGQDAVLALEGCIARSLLFLQKGKPVRLYLGNPAIEPGGQDPRECFLRHARDPRAEVRKIEVFKKLVITPDPEAGTPFAQLLAAASPPPPRNVRVRVGGREVLQRPFMPPAMTMGRDRTCEIMLDSLGISRRHARLGWERGMFLLEDLGSANGTLLGGRPITRTPIDRGMCFAVGEYELELIDPPELATSSTVYIGTEAHAGGFLVGPGGASIELLREITLGRARGVDVRVTGWGVQAVHARIRPIGPGVWHLRCFDRGKVLVNKQKVSEAELRYGDALVLGKSAFFLVSKA
jgi:hypothetical protein